MNRCPITYDECAAQKYSSAGLKLLDRRLEKLSDFPYSAEEQRQEAIRRADKMSIQGVQPKLSARLNVKDGKFEIVDVGGRYILKPQSNLYEELPQNEDLTMRLAASVGIDVPLHGLLHSSDGSLTYFIRRFDRQGRTKIAVEDFAQLGGKTRDTKYDSSMEQVASLIERFTTFPLLEKIKLLRLTLINYFVGNEDMHLKNFSLIRREGKIELSPAYDLINTTIAIGEASEEIALPIDGRKKNLSKSLFLEYFGRERLNLPDHVIEEILSGLQKAVPGWPGMIEKSFFSAGMKRRYVELLKKRSKVLGL